MEMTLHNRSIKQLLSIQIAINILNRVATTEWEKMPRLAVNVLTVASLNTPEQTRIHTHTHTLTLTRHHWLQTFQAAASLGTSTLRAEEKAVKSNLQHAKITCGQRSPTPFPPRSLCELHLASRRQSVVRTVYERPTVTFGVQTSSSAPHCLVPFQTPRAIKTKQIRRSIRII